MYNGDEEENTGFEDLEEDEEFAATIEYIKETGEQLKQENSKGAHVIVPEKIKVFYSAYKALQEIFAGQNVSVKTSFSKLFLSAGFLEVRGESLDIKDVQKFMSICRAADNMEITPRTDSTYSLAFGFYGLTKHVAEVEE